MAASTAQHSYGTTLTTSTTSGGTYTGIAELIDINDDAEVPGSDVTHLLSDGATKECKPKLVDPGTVTFKLNFTKTQYNTILGYMTARAQRWWKITCPDGSIVGPFFAHVQKLGKEIPADDKITNNVTLMRSGALAFTPAA